MILSDLQKKILNYLFFLVLEERRTKSKILKVEGDVFFFGLRDADKINNTEQYLEALKNLIRTIDEIKPSKQIESFVYNYYEPSLEITKENKKILYVNMFIPDSEQLLDELKLVSGKLRLLLKQKSRVLKLEIFV